MSQSVTSEYHGFTVIEVIVVVFIMTSFSIFFGNLSKGQHSRQKERDEIIKFVGAFSESVYFCRLKSMSAKDAVVLTIAPSRDCFAIFSTSSMQQSTRRSFNKDLFTDLEFWTNPPPGADISQKMTKPEIIFKEKFCEPFKLKFKFIDQLDQGIKKNKTILVNRPSIDLSSGKPTPIIKLEL
jgi:hypothetical protein